MMMSRPSLPVTLYVGNLDEAVHEEQLFAHFSKYGPLHSIKIVKDRNTGKPRGFGYVNFIHYKDAETARMIAQYDLIGRKPIRILHKGDPRQKTDANLFVKNIDPQVSFKDLHNHFSKSGSVLSVKIAYNSSGQHLGYGYVQFEKPEDATKAIHELNGSKLKEQEITVEKFLPRTGRKVSSNNNLYVKHLPEGKTKEEIEKLLNDYFAPFGKILSLLAMSKDSKVWSAFICFEAPESAQAALNQLNGSEKLDGADQPLYVSYHVSRQERALERKQAGQDRNETNIFIKNLKPEVTDVQIHDLFKTYGEITKCGVKETEFKGQKYKMAFVNYKYPDEAIKAQSDSSTREEIKKLFYNDSPYIGMWLAKDQRQQFKQTRSNRQPFNVHLQQNPQPFGMMPPPQQQFGMMQPQQQFGGFPMKRPPFSYNQHLNPMGQPQNPQQMQNQPVPQQQQGGFQPRGGQGGPGGPGGRSFGGPRQGGFVNTRPDQRGNYRGGQGGQQRMGGPGGNQQQQPYNRSGPGPNQNRRPPNQQAQQDAPVGTGPVDLEVLTQKPETQAQLTVQNLKDKLDDFMKLEPEKQRNILGELLYPKILGVAGPTFAPKITGMLVDFDVLTIQDILELLEDQATLNERISEAQELIMQEGDA
eukprot:CAMPEP_0176475568 /NCGR_PEP_ID=MMETSP0127-20121128/43677_1 /TAXON_ID=938130 /ORGANISM="Platyophrya macrostoma, Strain WH" /LENGTH=641 /DNA_ID=CAMNT_0017871175 /DNA_START=60 /DNA_END=1985 /DNA_ORIENTATION=+